MPLTPARPSEKVPLRGSSEPIPSARKRRAARLPKWRPQAWPLDKEGSTVMMGTHPDALAAVLARHRRRARLRAGTVALGAASLVTAGLVAYTLPAPATHTVTTSSAGSTAGQRAGTVHTVSGGSGTTTTQTPARSGPSTVATPAASTGSAHASSGGS